MCPDLLQIGQTCDVSSKSILFASHVKNGKEMDKVEVTDRAHPQPIFTGLLVPVQSVANHTGCRVERKFGPINWLLWFFGSFILFCKRQACYDLIIFPFIHFNKTELCIKMFCSKISRLIRQRKIAISMFPL